MKLPKLYAVVGGYEIDEFRCQRYMCLSPNEDDEADAVCYSHEYPDRVPDEVEEFFEEMVRILNKANGYYDYD